MPTQKQKAIILYLQTGEKEKSQIVNKFHRWYYHNAYKHIGDVLSRIVESNLIIRKKRGVYALPEVQKEGNIPNQISLF